MFDPPDVLLLSGIRGGRPSASGLSALAELSGKPTAREGVGF
ncbi:hypothetical protein A176_002068 [Myxococcus hansupus]|uniref:Uncharacterized protein n=1 Tax=Pseudomyxococcus hansupus TaxID=1297742 RepID=A0A0H4WNV4_9BACT|nr:hypothetical protein A176_002068 [Myxococcus hansupus]